eukprot:gnl/Chilomastix_caulleri/3041.p2 GENE.gnl/Chilomastix_caulleri/3041~~gnl/Chilomastix_caulleri/3041.p2  ORF type:complete len:59 (+),score=28.82 gnl/Chilomastix_caulleri/3041:225-401(+)
MIESSYQQMPGITFPGIPPYAPPQYIPPPAQQQQQQAQQQPQTTKQPMSLDDFFSGSM